MGAINGWKTLVTAAEKFKAKAAKNGKTAAASQHEEKNAQASIQKEQEKKARRYSANPEGKEK